MSSTQARLVRHPFAWEGNGAEPAPPVGDGPLRLLYLGRLERRKGVRALVDALLGLEHGEWRLTIVGADTDTAPLGGSMRDLLELEIAGDPRIELLEAVPRDRIPALLDAHDALVDAVAVGVLALRGARGDRPRPPGRSPPRPAA